jgi:RNA polymerase-binding transcription factor
VSKSPAKKAPARKAAASKAAPRKAAAKPKAAARPVKAVKSAKTSAKPAAKAAKTPIKAPTKAPAKASAKAGTKPVASKTKHVAPAKEPKSTPARSAIDSKPSAPKPLAAAAAPIGVTSPKPVSPAPLPAPSTLPKTSDKPLASPAAVAASSRFTERFAPPRPPQRVLPEPVEAVRPAIKADPRLANAWKNKSGRDLTEDELLAMPDAEYMNDKQLEFFRARLQTLKDDLLSNAVDTTEHLREDTSIVPDPADRATIEEEHALELRTRDRERKLLKKISQSLARIEAGDYGYCDETGEPIGLGRLLARPTATLSLEAQQRRELKQKMFGD